MEEKTLIKENKIKIIWNLLWKEDDNQEAENVEEIKDIDKDTLKGLKEALRGVKALEDKYGIEPKSLKTSKKSPRIRNATIHRQLGNKGENQKTNNEGENQKINNKEENDNQIQEK